MFALPDRIGDLCRFGDLKRMTIGGESDVYLVSRGQSERSLLAEAGPVRRRRLLVISENAFRFKEDV